MEKDKEKQNAGSGLARVRDKLGSGFGPAKSKPKESKRGNLVVYVLLGAVIIVLLLNQFGLFHHGAASSPTGLTIQEALADITPTGTPKIYGNELGVSYDQPTSGLSTLAALEFQLSYRDLSPSQQVRFTAIAKTSGTSCEFCCGMGSNGFGFESGTGSDCGCQHNQAFSGLTKYLLKNHEDEFTDEEIMGELKKWKTLFFPKQMVSIYLSEQAAAGAKLSDEAAQLPSMVGGC